MVNKTREVKLRLHFFFVSNRWAGGACGTRSLFLDYFFFDLGIAFRVPRQHGGAR